MPRSRNVEAVTSGSLPVVPEFVVTSRTGATGSGGAGSGVGGIGSPAGIGSVTPVIATPPTAAVSRVA